MTRCIWLSRPGNGSNRKSRPSWPAFLCFLYFYMPIRQRVERRRMYPHGSGWPPDWPEAARAEIRSCLGELGGHQGREEQPMVHLPHGGDRQPPGRPGAARGIWSCPCGSWWPLGKGRAAYASSFPMEVARSRQSGPEWPGEYEVAHVGAGWPPGKGRADGCTLSWRRPAAVRPARSERGINSVIR